MGVKKITSGYKIAWQSLATQRRVYGRRHLSRGLKPNRG